MSDARMTGSEVNNNINTMGTSSTAVLRKPLISSSENQ